MRARPSHDNAMLLKLRRTRKLKGISQDALAKMIGCYPSAISRWEFGDLSPTLENAAVWANILGFDITLIRKEIHNGQR